MEACSLLLLNDEIKLELDGQKIAEWMWKIHTDNYCYFVVEAHQLLLLNYEIELELDG